MVQNLVTFFYRKCLYSIYKVVRFCYSIVKEKMQEAGAGAADRERRKEKVEINFLDRRSLLRFGDAYAISDFPVASSTNEERLRVVTLMFVHRSGTKGKGAAEGTSCAISRERRKFRHAARWSIRYGATHRERRAKETEEGPRFQLGPPREDKELPGVAGAASRKLTIGHRYGDLASRVLRLGQSRAPANAHASLA